MEDTNNNNGSNNNEDQQDTAVDVNEAESEPEERNEESENEGSEGGMRKITNYKYPCDICRSNDEVLSLLKSFGTMGLEYKCANCIIKEFWKNTVNKRN